MKCLIVEDDFVARKLILTFLSKYAECDVAVNGKEATEAFRDALETNQPYDLVTLDINMPEMNGQEALKIIRRIESESGIEGLDSVKIIMTTALEDKRNVLEAFKSGCEAYINKPVRRTELIEQMEKLELIPAKSC